VAAEGWNHNTHYHDVLLRLLPPKGRVLDVGCGGGTFARRLAAAGFEVVAVDTDAAQVDATRARCADVPRVAVVHDDVMAMPFTDGSFDAVTVLAALHHLPFEPFLQRAAGALRPGGRLVVLGVWPATASSVDLATSAVATVAHRLLALRHGPPHMSAPTVAPSMPLSEVRRRAAYVLPGARVERRLLWRYVLTWTKPG
jgi:2-polyprenyl-3-methyl-5-hydroxy-6-metoxy-1,4-benzoquinol methylase